MQSADSWDAPVQTVEREESIAQAAPQDDQPIHAVPFMINFMNCKLTGLNLVESDLSNHEDKEISHNEVTNTKGWSV